MDIEERKAKFKELRKMKRIRRANPSSKEELNMIVDFYDKVDEAKNKLKNNIEIGNDKPEQVAKMSKKAHIAHELFKKKIFDIKQKKDIKYEDLRNLRKDLGNILSKVSNLENTIDG